MSANENEKIETVEPDAVKIETAEPDLSSIEVKNPRIGKVLKLEEEVARQNELEKLRSRRIRQEQDYIDKMINSVETNLRNTREEEKYNREFEEQIKNQVYRMHGISEDKLQGMEESRRAWYQGAAFALFFLSLCMIVLCGVLHGFGSEICIFMAFYTAIEGTLLSNGRKQSKIFEGMIKALYLLLFPVMMVVFVCYELGFEEYSFLVPIFTMAGVVVLIIGAISYFIYDPYRVDRRNRKKANSYIREMEKTALKEVRLKEKAFVKQKAKEEKNQKKEEARAKKEQERENARQEKCEKKEAWWQQKKDWLASKWRKTAKPEEEEQEEEEQEEKVQSEVEVPKEEVQQEEEVQPEEEPDEGTGAV